MPRWPKVLAAATAALSVAGAGGFVLFVDTVRATAVLTDQPQADGIVVLTGGEDRILAGADLLKTQRGRRLLITGVNPRTGTPSELKRAFAPLEVLQRCCVDLGRDAVDTVGNAEEAREWAELHGFRRLIVVTSSYHMPRSLAEFARVMPGVTLSAHAVPSRHYQLGAWWHHVPTARLLMGEYLKYLTALARLGVSRVASEDALPPTHRRQPVARLP